MLEHLDGRARHAVDVAIGHAHELGHSWLGTEHVLIGILTEPDTLPEGARALLPSAEAVLDRLRHGLRGPSSPPSDEELLASLGIDLGQVRRRAAATFGAQAVERTTARLGVFGWRRRPVRRCDRSPRRIVVLPGQGVAMAPRLKRAFEQARRRSRGGELVTPAVLLAALLSIHDALATELLGLMGVDVARVRAALDR
jgi:hypothetical protein